MGLFGKLTSSFESFKGDLTLAASRYTQKDFLEGVIAAGLWIGYADGNFDADERNKMIAGVKIRPELKAFNNGDMIQIFNTGVEQFEFDLDGGKAWAINEIKQAIGKDPEKGKVILMIATAIARQGGIGAEEQTALDELARLVGIN